MLALVQQQGLCKRTMTTKNLLYRHVNTISHTEQDIIARTQACVKICHTKRGSWPRWESSRSISQLKLYSLAFHANIESAVRYGNSLCVLGNGICKRKLSLQTGWTCADTNVFATISAMWTPRDFIQWPNYNRNFFLMGYVRVIGHYLSSPTSECVIRLPIMLNDSLYEYMIMWFIYVLRQLLRVYVC